MGFLPFTSQPPGTGSHLSGVVWGSGDVKQPCGASNVLFQSKVRGGASVTLAETNIVPPHSEVIVEGRITCSVDSELGMVSPLTGQQRDSLGVHVAYVVAQATLRTVPVRIANTSEDEVEIVSGRKIAEFSVLSESPVCNNCNNSSTANTNPDPFCCSSVDTSNLLDEIEAAIDPSLNQEDKAKLRKVLLQYSDIFEDTLGQTSVLSHTIDTGDSPPIKQRPRRLPYAHREEVDKRVKDMLAQGVIEPSSSPWLSLWWWFVKKMGRSVYVLTTGN